MPLSAVGFNPFFDSSVDEVATDVYQHRVLVFFLHIINPNATDAFLQCFDALAADVTVGTTVPTYSFLLPGGTGASNRGAYAEQFEAPLQFNTALSIAITTTATGNTGPGTDCVANIGFLAG